MFIASPKFALRNPNRIQATSVQGIRLIAETVKFRQGIFTFCELSLKLTIM